MAEVKLKTTSVVILIATAVLVSIVVLVASNFYFLNSSNKNLADIDNTYNQKLDIMSRMTHIARERTVLMLAMYVEDDEWLVDEDCYDKLMWVPDTISWKLIKHWGGAIATIGNTGLGWVAPGEGCTGSLDGWINSHFFLTYAELIDDENCTLGMVHGDNIKSYIQTFSPNTNAKHRKTVEEWALIGDPSLKIGGYPV